MIPASVVDSVATPRSSRAFHAVGLLLIFVGLAALFGVDARAENGWSFFACAAVLMGYTAVAAAILIRRN